MSIRPMLISESNLPLHARNFTRIAGRGFGDVYNNRAQSMAWFHGKLFVGVTRHRPPTQEQSTNRQFPLQQVGGPGMGRVANYAHEKGQIWCYDPRSNQWRQVFVAPLVRMPDGRALPREAGYRKMVVLQDPTHNLSALYVSTISPLGSLILRSLDGEHFEPVQQPNLPKGAPWSYRSLLVANDRLYTAPCGRVRGETIERNRADCALIFENAEPARAPWQIVTQDGFGNPNNQTIYEMIAFNKMLYAATFNPETGFEIWKTCPDHAPYRWQRVMVAGAFRGKPNQAVASMCVFRGALYIGTGTQSSRREKAQKTASSASELIRLYSDNSWELIVGEARATPVGFKVPISGLDPGFGHEANGVIWEMAEHDGWLYAGTEDASSFLGMLALRSQESHKARHNNALRDYVEAEAGCDLWRSHNGTDWEPVTRVGFGNSNNFGIESMLSTPLGLFVGTVSIPYRDSPHHVRQNGSFGHGCEVWLGSR